MDSPPAALRKAQDGDSGQRLVREAQALFGIHLTGRQLSLLASFERELTQWSEKFNLTAIRDPEGIRIKHFLDSLSCALAWKDRPPLSLVDVGTGAGLPGVPLKILYPQMKLTLVESVGKKAGFCRHVVEQLGLENVEVAQMRAEDLGQMTAHRERYQWAVARAVASLPVLAEYLLPLVQVGGAVVAQKGESGPAEAHAAQRAMSVLGGRLRQVLPVTLPGVADERYLIVIDKSAATPVQYPRKPGLASKHPL
jgi:16S rRNA (guanine527-N7)-methyltransferase